MGTLAELPVEGNSGLVCGADDWSAAGVFVFGGDVADAFVQPHGAAPPTPRADLTGSEASAAHSPIAVNDRQPASTAHTASARIAVI
jgi:hypothetical protein